MLQPILLFCKRIENPYKILQRSGNINSYVDLRNRKTTLDEDIYVRAAVLARGLVDVGNDVKIFILFSTPVNIMTDIAQKLSRGSIELKSTWFFFLFYRHGKTLCINCRVFNIANKHWYYYIWSNLYSLKIYRF